MISCASRDNVTSCSSLYRHQSEAITMRSNMKNAHSSELSDSSSEFILPRDLP